MPKNVQEFYHKKLVGFEKIFYVCDIIELVG